MKLLALYIWSFLGLLSYGTACYGQEQSQYDTIWFGNAKLQPKTDGDPCYYLIDNANRDEAAFGSDRLQKSVGRKSVTGDITYDFLYRSLIDTPIYTKGFQQHTLSMNLKVLYRDKYPLNVRFQVRKSNQPLFRDIADINIGFNKDEFARKIQARVKEILSNQIASPQLPELKREYAGLVKQKEEMIKNMNMPSLLQKIVEERERMAYKARNMDRYDSMAAAFNIEKDSIYTTLHASKPKTGTYQEKYNDYRTQLGNLNNRIKLVGDSLIAKKQEFSRKSKRIDSLSKRIKKDGLIDFSDFNAIPKDSLPKGTKQLLAVRRLDIGRTMLDYSELTAKNICMTGINLEYNPKWYFAAAGGSMDWQFRDFQARQRKLPKQYLGLVRLGYGDKDKSAIIFTYFTGRRNLLAQYSTGNTGLEPSILSGVSMEAIYHLGKQHAFSFEVAKSTMPDGSSSDSIYNGVGPSRKWMDFKGHDNEAYSIKYKGNIEFSKTVISGSYRRIGKAFQTLSFYNTPTRQDAYNADIEQKVGNWMDFRLGLQKNQFNLPLAVGGLKSDLVFKTFQANLHYKRWPLLMVGFFPSSQLTLVDGLVPMENRFYTFNISATHGYRMEGNYMNSSLVYTRFYNQGSDTGFIYYNARNISFTQMIWMGKWSLEGAYTLMNQNAQQLDVWNASATCAFSRNITLSGGLKWNSLTETEGVMGYSAGCTFLIKNFGAIQGTWDKSFWPGQKKDLVPNTNGRFTLIKTF